VNACYVELVVSKTELKMLFLKIKEFLMKEVARMDSLLALYISKLKVELKVRPTYRHTYTSKLIYSATR